MRTHMARRTVLAAALMVVLLVQRPAHALVTIMGEGMAKKCFEAAEAVTKGRAYFTTMVSGVTLASPVELCSMALTEPLNVHDRAGTLVNRGVLQFEQAKYDVALQDFDDAIRISPSLGEAHSNRGAALVGMQKWEAGIVSITKGIEMDAAEMEKSYYNRALAYEAIGNVKGAYYDFMKASELAPAWELPKTQLARFSVKKPAE